MTDELKALTDRLERIEDRQEKFEKDFMAEIRAIGERITQLALSAAARRECPSPGLCLMLQERVGKIENDGRSSYDKIVNLQKWQSWIMGALVILGVIITFFGPAIRHTFNIQQ